MSSVVGGRARWLFAVLLFAGLCLPLLALSFVPFEAFKSALDQMAPDGDAEQVTRDLHARLAFTLRAAGAFWLAVAVALSFLYDNIGRAAASLAASFADLGRDVQRSVVEWLRTEERAHVAAVLVSIVVGAGLRVYHLFQPIRSDEAWTFLNYASRPLLSALSSYDSPNNHILHTLLAKLSIATLGDHVWALRLPALVAGTLLLPAIYFLCRRLYGRGAGVLAMALVAVWPVLIDYAANARGYSLVMLLSVVLYASADRIRRHDDPAAHAVFAIAAALGLYTVPIFAFAVGAAGLWLATSALVESDGTTAVSRLVRLSCTGVAALALTFALYIPAFVTSGFAAVFANDVVLAETSGSLLERLWPWAVDLWADWHESIPPIATSILACGFGWTVVRHSKVAHHRVPIWIPLVVWCGAVILVLDDYGPARVWLFALPLYLGVSAAGLASLLAAGMSRLAAARTSALVDVAAFGVVLGGGLPIALHVPGHYYEEFGAMREAEGIVLALAERLREGDGFITTFPANKPVAYYAHRHGLEETVDAARLRVHDGNSHRGGALPRVHVVLNSADDTVEAAFAYHSRIPGADTLRASDYEVVDVTDVGEARLLTLELRQSGAPLL